MKSRWLAPIAVYGAVILGLYGLRNAWAALLGFHIAIVVSLLLAKPKIPVSLLIKSSSLKWIALSIAASVLCVAAVRIFWLLFGIAGDLSSYLQSIGLNKLTWPLFIIYFSLVNPFIEEYFWRGHFGSEVNTLALFDFVFAGYHLLILFGRIPILSLMFAFLMLALASWFWRQIARVDSGLLAPVLGHMAADLGLLLILYFL